VSPGVGIGELVGVKLELLFSTAQPCVDWNSDNVVENF
jgi:hypothetical protein